MSKENLTVREVAARVPPPRWVVEMHEHYDEAKSYRPEDIVQVLGDQTKRVALSPCESAIKSFFGLS